MQGSVASTHRNISATLLHLWHSNRSVTGHTTCRARSTGYDVPSTSSAQTRAAYLTCFQPDVKMVPVLPMPSQRSVMKGRGSQGTWDGIENAACSIPSLDMHSSQARAGVINVARLSSSCCCCRSHLCSHLEVVAKAGSEH